MSRKDELGPPASVFAGAMDHYQRALLDNFPFMVWLKDSESRFLAVNRPFARATGHASSDSLRGKTDLDVWPRDLAEAYRRDDRHVMQTRRKHEVEEQIESSGSRKWYETYKAPVEVDGVLLGTVGFAREITDRKNMELALRESEKRYREILENVSDLLCLAEVDEDGGCRILELSASFERVMGITRAGWLGQYADKVLPRGLHDDLLEPLHRCMSIGVPVEREILLPTAVGERTYQASFVPVPCRRRVLIVARDITLQKQHDAVLRERAELQSRLARLAEVAPGVVGTYRRAPGGGDSVPPPSPKLEEITGCRGEDVMRDASVFVRNMHPDDVPVYLGSLKESGRHMAPWHHEFRMNHPRKGEIWLEGRAIPERLPDGSLEWYGFMHDVTERKRVESALRDSVLQVRALAARRDSELELERKRIARELHDGLGQLITAMRMHVSLLRVSFGAAHPVLAQSVGEMTRLIDSTIEVIRDAVSALRPAALDMGVASALEWLVREFSAHSGIACELIVEEDRLPLDEEAATAVFRIVQESLTNVARHARAASVTVTLRRAGERCVLRVRDDGRGFDTGAMRKNLGMVGMSERILALGGELDVSSATGYGTVIEARFPLQGERQAP